MRTSKSALKESIVKLGGEPTANTVSGLIVELCDILGTEDSEPADDNAESNG
jgi:hypothetical protein